MNLVEVIGLPGSGKTTVRQELTSGVPDHRSLEDAFRKVACEAILPPPISGFYRVIPLWLLDVPVRVTGVGEGFREHFHSTNADISTLAVQYAEKYTSNRDRIDRISRWVSNLELRYGAVEYGDEDAGTVISENGFGRAMSVFRPPEPIRSVEPSDVVRYARVMPLPRVVIHLDADTALCESRMRGRERGYPSDFCHLDTEEVLDVLEEVDHVLSVLADALSDRGVRVLQIDTSRSVEQVLGEIERNSVVATG